MLNALRFLAVFLLLAVSAPLFGQAGSPPPPPPPPPAPAPANSQWRDQKAVLSGVVTDGSGRALGNALLTFSGKYSGTRVQCRTSHSGTYKVTLELGVYAVEVRVAKVAPLLSEVTLSETTVRNFNFGTPPAGSGPPAPF